MTIKTVLWRGIYRPGHEACRVFSQNGDWHLAGTAVFSHQAEPCRLEYAVVCDAGWNTLSGKVSGWLGQAAVDVELAVDPERNWLLNGVECPAVAGCIDLDLNFSPSTNMLPIRRLNLGIGQEAEVRAAWLRFPSFQLEALVQIYRRVDESTYRYESGGGRFFADLEVDEIGLVTNYPGAWQAEAAT
ncbi:MAG: putative glycolipid-binding domain-containing protein [Acidobacteriota bacterium]